jgi:hypothetical protein
MQGDFIFLCDDYFIIIKKNTETLIDTSKEVGLEVNAEKTKYMLLYCLVTRMQGKIMTQRWLTDAFKMWHSSDIWE